jgi:AbrB family looped-hinge helix DNA binding protein
MQSVITSKFRTTIPKEVRERLNLSVYDTLEWKIYQGKILVQPVQKNFLEYRNKIKTGPGKIEENIKQARKQRVEKYRWYKEFVPIADALYDQHVEELKKEGKI